MNNRAPHCTAPNDPWLREAMGAYLLGALDPAESDRVAVHLAACSSCRSEYGELSEMLPLLASVSEMEAVNGPVRPEPAVLGRVLESTNRQLHDASVQPEPRRRRKLWPGRSTRSLRTRIVLAASAAVLVVGGVGAGMVMSAAQSLPPGSWTATTITNRATSGYAGHIDATVDVSPSTHGSSIHLRMDDVPAGYTCTMVVIGTAGQREATGTWKANAGGSFAIPGWTSLAPDMISSIQVDLPNGNTLLTLDHPH
ncbi:MAG TPA: zf-HC2 domain-containing protein [Actinocrinis sp.]|uniref:zf-HC2 domain-containing protein n=1 Tax=Actinocrinis sp. TaxID=1920516 RepID=UPI002DDDB224|nr:zf-HC2 domain-containing protein [Actinocrinis sp.]HEV2346584.1 zf-HC2 domain-containing protein [Actinocrinis sp.]